MEPGSLTYIFLLKFFFLGSVPIIIIAIVTHAVMEKRLILETVSATLWGCFWMTQAISHGAVCQCSWAAAAACCKVRSRFPGTSHPAPALPVLAVESWLGKKLTLPKCDGLFCLFSSLFQLTMGSDEWVHTQMEREEQNAWKRAGELDQPPGCSY